MSHGRPSSSLDGARRAAELEAVRGGAPLDLLVVGGGVTGAGIALDAAARGLSVALVERRDLAWGTSRWSSKLVHGGLRYLAQGAVGVAHESARERGVLLARTAPHLVRPVPVLVPFHARDSRSHRRKTRVGFRLGDGLRLGAGTSGRLLPHSRHVTMGEALAYAPGLRREGLEGGLVAWDAQLVDDARLVVALARTAALHGARILTRVGALALTGDGAQLRDELTGERFDVSARAVVQATGVWTPELAPELALRPSRGSHIIVATAALGGLAGTINLPVPDEPGRWVFAVAQSGGRAYVGLTDEPVEGAIPDVPVAPQADVDFLLRTLSTRLERSLTRSDVLGSFAGLRPLLAGDATDAGLRTSDLSREHAVRRGPGGVITIVGGKLTTYRRMAEDAVDAAVRAARLPAGPCRTRRLPLVGAAPRGVLTGLEAPRRLVERYGTEAPQVVAEAGPGGLEPVAEGLEVTRGELRWAVRHELALDVGDVLDRRTRVGLVAADRARAQAAAEAALGAVAA